MDVKKIGLIAGLFFGSFVVVFIILYLLYPTINPEAVAALNAAEDSVDFSVETYDPKAFNSDAVTRLRRTVVDLQDSVRVYRQREARYLANIDSLSVQVAELLGRPVQPMASLPPPVEQVNEEQVQAEERVQEIAKTLLNLEEEELMPIANLMTEKELVDLYSSATKAQKEKLLRVLKPEKAANILKKVMS